RAARTRLVAPDLGAFAADRLRTVLLSGFGRARVGGRKPALGRDADGTPAPAPHHEPLLERLLDARRPSGRGRGRFLDLHLEVEEQAQRLHVDAVEHVDEQVVALALELDERVLLRVAREPDALPQVVD